MRTPNRTKRLPAPANSGRGARPASAQRALSVSVLEQFRIIFKSVKKHFQWVEQQTGVSGAQLWALAVIERTPGLRVSELARSLAIHQSTASNLLDRLEGRRLLRREREKSDQRVVRLFLTAKGRSIVAAAPRPLEGVLPDALSRLPEAQLAALKEQLDGVLRLMRVRDASGKRTPLSDI
jgi:DNA-binding MarR family transcriptional regulator